MQIDHGPSGLSWRARLSTVLWFLLAAGFVLALPVLTGVHPLVLPMLIAVALLLAALPLAWRRVRGSRWQTALRRGALSAVAWTFVLGIVLAAPIYYLALTPALRPLVVPQVTLSNGRQTLIFQGAVHVGSTPFYKAMVFDMERALSEGYILYYEGVRPDPAADRWFADTVAGGGDLNERYKHLGAACGLSFQGEYFAALSGAIRDHPERHVAADVTTLDLKQEYERLIRTDPDFARRVSEDAQRRKDEADQPDLMARLVEWAMDGNPRHRALAGVVCRGLMTIALAPRDKAPSTLDPLLLDFRNRALVARLGADAHDRIFINYGAAHFKGLLQALRADDPNWTVKDLRWSRALEAPEDLHGPAIE